MTTLTTRPSADPMPKQIWVMWLQGLEAAPAVVRACIDSWEQLNPDWELRVLDEQAVRRLAPRLGFGEEIWRLPAPRIGDVVRVALLREFGGVWADATCLCVRPLDEWLPQRSFFAFRDPGPDRMLSSWFLASPRGDYMMRRFSEEFARYCLDPRVRNDGWRFHVRRRLVAVLNQNTRRTDWWFRAPLRQLGVTPYFALHYLFARLVHTDPRFAAEWEAAPGIGATPSHRPQREGLDRPMSDGLRRDLERRRVPVYKLSRHIDPAGTPEDSLLRTLLARDTAAAGCGAGIAA